MRNLLITGGAGFIGSNYVRYVLQNHPDLNVVVFDKLTYAGNLDDLRDVEEKFHLRYRFVKGDICDAGVVNATLREYHIDTIVNFAAVYTPCTHRAHRRHRISANALQGDSRRNAHFIG